MSEEPLAVVGWELAAAEQRLAQAGLASRIITTAPPLVQGGRYHLGGEKRVIQQRNAGDEVVLVLAQPLVLESDYDSR